MNRPEEPKLDRPKPLEKEEIIPDVALRGGRWLAQLTPEHFVLEHGRFQSAAQAQTLIRARAELKTARLILVKSKTASDARFVLITGPFRSKERAQNYMNRENTPPQIRILRVSSVLQETVTRRTVP